MTGPTGYSIEQLRILLLRHLEGSLTEAEEREVIDLLRVNAEASRELEGLRRMMDTLKTDKTIFCPEPADIAEFVASGHDPDGKIAHHLKECESCAEEAHSLKNFRPAAKIPPRIWETVSGELAEQSQRAPGGESSERFSGLLAWFSSLFRMPVLAIGAAVLAALLVVFVYPRHSPICVVGLSGVTWGDYDADLITKLPVLPPGKERTAILLFFKDFKPSYPQEKIDALYQALRPGEDSKEGFELVPPARVRDIIAKEGLASTEQATILGALRKRLDIHKVVLVTIAPDREQFMIQSKVVDASTGKPIGPIIEEKTSAKELESKAREAAYAALRK